MRADEVLEWIRAAPFTPFRIRLNSGRTVDIRNPEMIKTGRTTVYIFTYSGDPDGPHEKVEMISLLLIESIEPIEAGQAA